MRRFVIFLSVSILLSSCKKHEPHALIYPIDGEEVMPCCTEFTWKGGGSSFRFQLDSTSHFNNPMVDTQIMDFQYYYPNQLAPNKSYYWKVSTDKSEATSEFVTRDVAADFVGLHMGSVHYQHWEINSGLLDDQNYLDTITINQLGEQVHVQFSQSPIDEITDYWHVAFTYYDPKNTISYSIGSGSIHCTLLLNFVNDSIYVKARSGGLGNYKTWEYRGKR